MTIKEMSKVLLLYVEHRDAQRAAIEELRRIAIEECGFEQTMVVKASAQDLVDGYIKGFLAASNKDGG